MSNYKSFIYTLNLLSSYKKYIFIIFFLVNGMTIAYYYTIEKINFTKIILTAVPGNGGVQVHDIFADYEYLFRNPINYEKWKKNNITIIKKNEIVGHELNSDKILKIIPAFSFENLPTQSRSIGIYFNAANPNFVTETFLYAKFTAENLNEIYNLKNQFELDQKKINFLIDKSSLKNIELKIIEEYFNLNINNKMNEEFFSKNYIIAKPPSGLYQKYTSLKKLLVYSLLSSVLFSVILLIFFDQKKNLRLQIRK
jgi:hypothetical protein